MHDMDASVNCTSDRRRFGAAESDILADRRIRIVHTWPHYHLIPNTTCMESLDVFHAGIAEVWILRADSALPNIAIQLRNDCHTIHTSSIPAWNTLRPSIHVIIGIKWWWGHVCTTWCVCQLQRQIRRRFGTAESDILADRRIRIVHTWPHYHLNTK